MTKRMILVLALAPLAVVGCKKSESKKAEEAPAEAPAPAKASDPAPSDPAPGASDPAPAAAEPAAAKPAAAPTDPALLKAAEAYVRKNAAKGFEFDLAVEAVEGDFARLVATPKKPDDGATVYMKRKGKTWTGVDMGTSISCDDLDKQGFPKTVSKGCD
jgi:hypothetical protein